MAVPKRRTSKARRDRRRASSYRLGRVSIVECKNCTEPKLPHRVCRSCGFYAGKQVLTISQQ